MDEIFGKSLPKVITELPGPNSKELARLTEKYEPRGIISTQKNENIIFWRKAHDANVYDVDGNLFIDCTSGFGVAAVGHSNASVTAAIQEQSNQLLHSVGEIFPHSLRAKLAEAIIQIAGRHLDYQLIFTNSGSEAVEVAIKTAILFTKKSGVISFVGGFHGQSIGALAVSSQREFRDPFTQVISPKTVFVTYPNPYRPNMLHEDSDTGAMCLQSIESLLQDRVSGIPDIGAIVVEPIQGVHGYIVPPPNFLSGLRVLCNKYKILLIADEIFTGFGRTGNWLAMDHENVVADITCVGKAMTGGLPLAACIAKREIMNAWDTDGFISLHGSTFAPNPLSCAAALATIEQMNSLKLIEKSEAVGQKLLEKFYELKEKFGVIGDVRGRGMALAIELVKDRYSKEPNPEATSKIIGFMLSKGVMCISTGYPIGNVIAFSPPLVISEAQLDYVVATLSEGLKLI